MENEMETREYFGVRCRVRVLDLGFRALGLGFRGSGLGLWV